MAQVEQKSGETHGAIRYLTSVESPAEVQERNRAFVGALFMHVSLIGVLAFSPARDMLAVPDSSTIAFVLDTEEAIHPVFGNFAPAPRAGSATGDRAPPSRPSRKAAPRLLGTPVISAPPVKAPTSVRAPAFAGVPMPNADYARNLIDRAIAAQHDPLGIERAIGTRKSIEELMEGPTSTPYTRAPTLLNPGDIQAFLLRRYPYGLQAAGVGGRAVLWLLIDEKGEVRKALLHTASGYKQLDKAALEAVPKMEFAAATHNGKNVPVWVQQPINFRTN